MEIWRNIDKFFTDLKKYKLFFNDQYGMQRNVDKLKVSDYLCNYKSQLDSNALHCRVCSQFIVNDRSLNALRVCSHFVVNYRSQLDSSMPCTAESVAISLLKKFSEKQIPKASDLKWLVSETDAPQKVKYFSPNKL